MNNLPEEGQALTQPSPPSALFLAVLNRRGHSVNLMKLDKLPFTDDPYPRDIPGKQRHRDRTKDAKTVLT